MSSTDTAPNDDEDTTRSFLTDWAHRYVAMLTARSTGCVPMTVPVAGVFEFDALG